MISKLNFKLLFFWFHFWDCIFKSLFVYTLAEHFLLGQPDVRAISYLYYGPYIQTRAVVSLANIIVILIRFSSQASILKIIIDIDRSIVIIFFVNPTLVIVFSISMIDTIVESDHHCFVALVLL